jgi:hypothetical protein
MTPTASAASAGPVIKVIYIMGWGRSGSTLLANILGQMPRCFSVGELSAIWDWGFQKNRSCGCGEPFHRCLFWSAVIRNLTQRMGDIDPEKWRSICRREIRSLRAPIHFLTHKRNPSDPALREFLAVTARLYESVRETSGCPVLIDSSKNPFYGGLLALIPQIELYTVHLIRDPRAVAYSWSIQKPQPDTPMQRMGPAKSSILWTLWNASAERIGGRRRDRYLRLRYEDLIRSPRPVVETILLTAQEDAAGLPFRKEHSVFLAPNHTIRGNPDRFVTGLVDLIPDTRWEKAMTPGARRIAALLAHPLLHRYGYDRRSGGRRNRLESGLPAAIPPPKKGIG